VSDITLHFSPLDIILMSPFYGWPGLIAGAAFGALSWKKRRIAGAVLGAIAGNFAIFGARMLMM
jgi:hypothetical protein